MELIKKKKKNWEKEKRGIKNELLSRAANQNSLFTFVLFFSVIINQRVLFSFRYPYQSIKINILLITEREVGQSAFAIFK